MTARSSIYLTFLVLITTLVLAETTSESLRFVTALWRHGDRAPSDYTFPSDTENGASSWPQGFGELTELGMKQQQYLGRYLRQRYVIDYNFLSPNYSTKEVYIRSTSYNRTIMSALSNLAGMYPTPTGVDYLENIPYWQPIPVHSRPREEDPMLWMDHPCPTFDDIYRNSVLKSAQVQQIEEENKDFLKFLSEKTGMKSMTLDDTWTVWDPLNCERIHNESHTWPDWVTPTVFAELTNLSDLSTTFYFHDLRLQRLRGSLLFNEIATRLDQKAHRPHEIRPPQLKYYAYSVHDTTITALLENLGAYNGHLPEYASALLFELHEKQPKVFTVETWYVNETWPQGPPVRVTVKGCDDQQNGQCTLETLVKVAGKNVPSDWWAECGFHHGQNQTTTIPDVKSVCDDNQPIKVAAIVLGVTTGVFLLAFISIVILYCRLMKRIKVARREY